ncbi:Peptidase S41 family protein ustP [Golovinomyces cichoracearum]|uniref:Peptidase S41 family protein ustP n=1 Tax=Golovinomyces cichoracearum TaxID=62708 RepID=A0A420IHF5_9PEZI|nr:Peptidase S41 family protein ustP [Golovinomyces cichoracearum]
MKFILFTLISLLLSPAKCLPGAYIERNELPTPIRVAPCAQVSASASAVLQDTPKELPTVTAQLAYECLTSVPINNDDATALVKSILPYIEWQSDLSYLKNPPKGSPILAVDIKAELNRILSDIKDRKYANEHAFQMDLFKVFQSVHDGHFRFVPDLISKALQFRRPVGLVSVSRDGIEIPRIYVDTDIREFMNGKISSAPSVVMKIDGIDATTFVTELMIQNNQHNPDAQYNMMMYGTAYDARFPDFGYRGLFSLGGKLAYFYPGPTTTIHFENGTEKIYENYATVVDSFDGVTDGPSMYQKFCTGDRKKESNDILEAKTSPMPVKRIQSPLIDEKPFDSYPIPHIISSDRLISGYFLDSPDFNDVAVLVIFSFQTESVLQFQSLIQKLISDSKARGKTKIIIDLSSNSGGNILCGYDAFRQFFPHLEQPGLTRFRSHEALKIITKQISQRASNFSLNSTDPLDYAYYQTPFNFRFDLNETNEPFLTYEDKFNPRRFNGDEFTSNLRWDLEDPTMTSSTWGTGMNITGYGDRKNFSQPFKSADIVLLHDGVCASTCAIFSDFMRNEAGVRSVAIGGRPNREIIEGIGGTKGANSYSFSSILKVTRQALDTGTPDQVASWESLTALTDLPITRSTDSAINVRDYILKANIDDGIPAQFVYQPADCRIYFEPAMTIDTQAIWNKVASVVWGDANCVAGSMKTQARDSDDRSVYMKTKNSRPHWEGGYSMITEMEMGGNSQQLIS